MKPSFARHATRRHLLFAAILAGICGAAGTVRSQQDAPASVPNPPANVPTSAPVTQAPSLVLSPLHEARDLVEVLEARLEIKRAELRECEVHLLQAKRRLATIQRMQVSDYVEALERVRWAEGMHKKGYYTDLQLRLERQRAEQLNPKLDDSPPGTTQSGK